MKPTLKSLIAAAFITITAVACSKNTDSNSKPPLTTTADAKVAFNAESGGVYKGVIVGSTGTLKVVLQDGKLVATVTIDGVTKELNCAGLSGWQSGQEIDSAVFINGDWSLKFSVHGDGTGVHVEAKIPGHDDITIVIAKEHSDKQILAYEGTYTIDSLRNDQGNMTDVSSLNQHGTWNFISYNDHLAGIYRSIEGDIFVFGGSVHEGAIVATGQDLQIQGAIVTENANGTWQTEILKGKWTGARKL